MHDPGGEIQCQKLNQEPAAEHEESRQAPVTAATAQHEARPSMPISASGTSQPAWPPMPSPNIRSGPRGPPNGTGETARRRPFLCDTGGLCTTTGRCVAM